MKIVPFVQLVIAVVFVPLLVFEDSEGDKENEKSVEGEEEPRLLRSVMTFSFRRTSTLVVFLRMVDVVVR